MYCSLLVNDSLCINDHYQIMGPYCKVLIIKTTYCMTAKKEMLG